MLAAESLALEILVDAGRHDLRWTRPGQVPAWLDLAEDYVRPNFRASLRVADVAEAAGVHPAHLACVFSEVHPSHWPRSSGASGWNGLPSSWITSSRLVARSSEMRSFRSRSTILMSQVGFVCACTAEVHRLWNRSARTRSPGPGRIVHGHVIRSILGRSRVIHRIAAPVEITFHPERVLTNGLSAARYPLDKPGRKALHEA